jgi:hypothetical protein
MGTTVVLAAAALALASPSPAVPTSAPVNTGAAVNTAGTNFLTASALAPGQNAEVSATTGDYLYWSFAASAGQTDTAQVTVTLPPSTDRHGPQTWSVDVFDGLRRRQACTAGPEHATADQTAGTLALSCTLRQVRSWADSWSGDPLPGTYYVRLTASDVPQADLGLAAQVQLHIAAKGSADDAQPEGGDLKAPLVPPGAKAAAPAVGAVAPTAPKHHWYTWLTDWNTRWYWTLGGAALAALAGIGGYKLTRHPRRWNIFG